MKTIVLSATLLALLFVLSAAPGGQLGAQDFPEGFPHFNPPPFDFNDNFYTTNGINVQQLDSTGSGRFGLFRQTGPPAHDGQLNWVIDDSNTDPDRGNVRILATTGGYVDDGTGAPTDFISIIAFLLNQNIFTGTPDARGILMHDIVGNFEAYAALRQKKPDGTFFTQPCLASQGITSDCFSVASVATPNLVQDWRFSTNRTAADGSSGSPFGYFCDDVLGIWIITYFYYTDAATNNPTPVCQQVLSQLAATNGVGLEGLPIIKTANELNNDLEANGCGAEFKLDEGGGDGGAVWLVCPAIPDPRNGAIARDAFADVVLKPNGAPLDPAIRDNFNCLQSSGYLCNETPPPTPSR
jgi:hypothetical protein